MRCCRIWWSAKKAGVGLALVASMSSIGGCGLQLPSVRSPFYLANDSSSQVTQTQLGGEAHLRPRMVAASCTGHDAGQTSRCRPPPRSDEAQTLKPKLPPGTIVVRRGETLYSIARRHRIPVDELADANGLETHEIDAGQELDLPRYAQR